MQLDAAVRVGHGIAQYLDARGIVVKVDALGLGVSRVRAFAGQGAACTQNQVAGDGAVVVGAAHVDGAAVVQHAAGAVNTVVGDGAVGQRPDTDVGSVGDAVAGDGGKGARPDGGTHPTRQAQRRLAGHDDANVRQNIVGDPHPIGGRQDVVLADDAVNADAGKGIGFDQRSLAVGGIDTVVAGIFNQAVAQHHAGTVLEVDAGAHSLDGQPVQRDVASRFKVDTRGQAAGDHGCARCARVGHPGIQGSGDRVVIPLARGIEHPQLAHQVVAPASLQGVSGGCREGQPCACHCADCFCFDGPGIATNAHLGTRSDDRAGGQCQVGAGDHVVADWAVVEHRHIAVGSQTQVD